MLSDRFYFLFFLITQLSSLSGFCTIKFNFRSQILEKSPWGRKLYRFHFASLIAWTLFVSRQTLRFYWEQDLNNFNLNFTCVMMGIFCLQLFGIFFFLEDEFLTLQNSLFIFLRRVKSKLSFELPTYARVCTTFVQKLVSI